MTFLKKACTIVNVDKRSQRQMKLQKYNQLIEARIQNQKAINELRQQSQVSPKQIQALFAEERRLSQLIQKEIAKLKK